MKKTSFGYVALIGLPNAGKSTLMNAMLGMKLSIVSPKEQTTRRRILGVFNRDQTQIAFCDTPGLFQPKTKLDTAMMKVVFQSIKDADAICIVIDMKKPLGPIGPLIQAAQQSKRPISVILNKVDVVPKIRLLEYASLLQAAHKLNNIFMVSALKNQGVSDLINYLCNQMPEGPWMYDEEMLTDLSSQALATEFTREKLFSFLHQEIPYGLMVQHELWQEEEKTIHVHQKIIIEKNNHKGIVLGVEGELIKKVRLASQKDLRTLLGKRIKLHLRVVLKEDWKTKVQYFQEQGLDF
jgi:GTPase